jgi:hypothetical protein
MGEAGVSLPEFTARVKGPRRVGAVAAARRRVVAMVGRMNVDMGFRLSVSFWISMMCVMCTADTRTPSMARVTARGLEGWGLGRVMRNTVGITASRSVVMRMIAVRSASAS